MPADEIFQYKSRLRISTGSFPLPSFEGLKVTISAGGEEFELERSGPLELEHLPELRNEEGDVVELEQVRVRVPLEAGNLRLEPLFLGTSRWPHAEFRTGDAEDVFWFFHVQRNIFVKPTRDSVPLGGGPDNTIFFGPCGMDGVEQDSFEVRFADGSNVSFLVRAVSGVQGLGYYVGRLVRARGEVAGTSFDELEHERLAFFGSTRAWSEQAIPTLAVRFSDEDSGICGIVLDSSQWDSERAVDGYVAYAMTCDETLGERLELASVEYPARYSLP